MTFALALAAIGWDLVWPAVPFAFAAFAAWYVGRHGGGTALAEMERANGILERAVVRLNDRVGELEKENAALHGRTDVATVMERIMAQHEQRDSERFERVAVLLSLIASHLGKEREA